MAETTLDDLKPQRPMLEDALTNAHRPTIDATLARIAPSDRPQLEAALRTKHQPVTDANVLQLFLRLAVQGR